MPDRMKLEAAMRALADQTRLRIMHLLGTMELAVGELAQVLGQSQPRVSRHVAILCDAGLAERRREGSWVFLRTRLGEAESGSLGEAIAAVLGAAERDDEQFRRQCQRDRQHLVAIREAREAEAADWFAQHAGEWDELRRLHMPDEAVERALVTALQDETIGALLDIGTGTGRMAELFGDSAGRIVALDKSLEMLRVARAKLQHLPAERIELIRGDFASLPFPDGEFDTVLFHQVLHYAAEPERALAEAARVLRPEGRIAIVDFAAHTFEELRERYQHVRLGFTDGQMKDLLTRAGFAPRRPVTLEGKQLAVKLWVAKRSQIATRKSPRRKETAR